jgi:hypothetical protein
MGGALLINNQTDLIYSQLCEGEKRGDFESRDEGGCGQIRMDPVRMTSLS